MKYVSCRRNFDSVDGDPVDNQAWFGNPVIQGDELLLVHGYNCQAEGTRDAYRANSELARESGITVPLVGYLWPGLGGNWVQSLEFHRAQAQADQSAVHLATYLNSGPPINVMAHSLGARVVLEAVSRHGARIRSLTLIGAAVDRDCFLPIGEYADVTGKLIGKLHVFWSLRDDVLGRAFRLDQFNRALGYDGPEFPEPPAPPWPWVQSTEVTDSVSSHGRYRYDRNIWKAVRDDISAMRGWDGGAVVGTGLVAGVILP